MTSSSRGRETRPTPLFPDLKLMPYILSYAFSIHMTKTNDVDKPGTQYKDNGQLAIMMSQRTDIEQL